MTNMFMRLFFLTLFLIPALLACHAQKGVQSSAEKPRQVKTPFISTLHFDKDKSVIKDANIIKTNALWLLAHPQQVVILEGHCDESGDDEYNLWLGDRRSRTVMEALMKYGVPEEQLIIMSYGKTRPLLAEQNKYGWAQNRRVEFVRR